MYTYLFRMLTFALFFLSTTITAYNDEANKKLFDTIKDGNVSAVTSLLQDNANPNCLCGPPTGSRALHWATLLALRSNTMMELDGRQFYGSSSRDAIVERLLLHKAQVNAQNKAGLTPLHLAAFQGNSSVANCLIQYGADPLVTTFVPILPVSFIDWIKRMFSVNTQQSYDDVFALLEHKIENEKDSYPWQTIKNILQDRETRRRRSIGVKSARN